MRPPSNGARAGVGSIDSDHDPVSALVLVGKAHLSVPIPSRYTRGRPAVPSTTSRSVCLPGVAEIDLLYRSWRSFVVEAWVSTVATRLPSSQTVNVPQAAQRAPTMRTPAIVDASVTDVPRAVARRSVRRYAEATLNDFQVP